MSHVFLLLLYVGVGNERTLVSDDMYFWSVLDCNYFASQLTKRYGFKTDAHKDLGTAYCVPKLVNSKEVTIY